MEVLQVILSQVQTTLQIPQKMLQTIKSEHHN